MANFLFYLLSFAVVLGTLIIVHEMGHYAVARWCGVKVLRFAFGFGRIIYSRRVGRDGTEWALAAFPLGGYVKMLDSRVVDGEPGCSAAEAPRAFDRQPVGKRMAIVAAGPGANFVLAIVLYWALFWHGVEEPRALLGAAAPASIAARAGIENGERVTRVGPNQVATWADFRWAIVSSAGNTADGTGLIEVETINARQEINVRRLDLTPIVDGKFEGDPLEALGISFFRPPMPPVLGKVVAGGVAAAAGLQVGDVIVAIAGEPVADWSEVVHHIRLAAGKPLDLSFRRAGEVHQVNLVPQVENGVGRIGVAVQDSLDPEQRRRQIMMTVEYSPLVALGKAVNETWEKSAFSLKMIGRMLIGEVSWRNLSGPVTIADYAGQSARLGADYFIRFLAMVSISLGVLNLLPVPVLDGGHLMYHIVELIKRSPVSPRSMEIGQQIGMALLFSLITFAFYNDINRLLVGS